VWCRSRDCGYLDGKRQCKQVWGEADSVTRQQRELTMSEGKCALYLGAIFSTLFRIFSYIFLRVVCFDSSSFSLPVFSDNGRFRPLSDGVNTCFLASISLILRPFPSPLVSPNHRSLHLHPRMLRRTSQLSQPRLLKTRQAFLGSYLTLFCLTTSIGLQQQRCSLGAAILHSYYSPHVNHNLVH